MTTQSEQTRDLAVRIEAALAENARDFTRHFITQHPDAGAAYLDLDSGVACYGGRYAGPNVGRCWGWGMAGPPSDVDLAKAEAFYAERGHPPGFFVNPHADTGLVSALKTRGYVKRREDVVLCGDVERVLKDAPADRLRQVSLMEARDQALIVRGYRDAYDVPNAEDVAVGNAEALAHGNSSLFVLEDEGEFLGLCTLWSANGVAYLAGGGVLPAHRGRGLQRELAYGRLRRAAKRGADLVLVTVAPDSAAQTNMLRLGLTPVWTSAVWERAP